MRPHLHNWRPERAVPIADAIQFLLDDLEWRLEQSEHRRLCDPLPLSTGLTQVDDVCGGGLRRGTVTVLDTVLPAQGRALIYTIARCMQVPVLLASSDLLYSARWILAGAAAVPAELIRTGQLSSLEWHAIANVLPEVANRDTAVTDAASVPGLSQALSQGGQPVLLVEDIDRFGPASECVQALAELATSSGTAVLATASEPDELPTWVDEEAVRILVVPHALASRAALVTTDRSRGLAAAQVSTDCLIGDAS